MADQNLPSPGLYIDNDLVDLYGTTIDQILSDIGRNVVFYLPPIESGCPNCFEFDTIIRTTNGLSFIEDIRVDDIVYDIYGNAQRVINTFCREYEGEFVNIKVEGFNDFSCTPNHGIYIKRDGLVRKIPAEELNIGDICLFPIQSIDRESPAKWNVNWTKYCNWKYTDDFVNNVRSYRKNHTRQQTSNRFNISTTTVTKMMQNDYRNICSFDDLKIDDDLLYIIGWYISEGCVNSGKHKREVIYCLCDDEKDVALELIRIFKKKFKLSKCWWEDRKDNKNLVIHFYNSELARFLDDVCGHTSYNKRIPDFLYNNLSLDDLQKLIYYIINGDGQHRSTKYIDSSILECTSKILSYQIFTIWQSSGYSPSLNFRPAYIAKCGQRHSDSWHIRASTKIDKKCEKYRQHIKRKTIKKTEERPVIEINRTFKNTTVYNLNVENSHTYIASNFSVSNCNPGFDGSSQGTAQSPKSFPAGSPLNKDFGTGMPCPVCKGTYKILTKVTRTYKCFIQRTPKDFEYTQYGIDFDPGNIIQLKNKLVTFEDIRIAEKALIDGDLYSPIRYPTRTGLRDLRYVKSYWMRMNK